jgi:circadian clock protein KaiB
VARFASAKQRQPDVTTTIVKTKRTNRTAKAPPAPDSGRYVLRLYVAGATARSKQALQRVRHLCETELKGNYDLQVIDIYQQPIIARNGQILATPTLVREFPRPMRRLIGNLADTHGFFVGLDLDTKPKE